MYNTYVDISHTCCLIFSLFFFNATATTEIYTLSLHDALPISKGLEGAYYNDEKEALQVIGQEKPIVGSVSLGFYLAHRQDRKSTRLNSSHVEISYAVFCLKKKKKKNRKKKRICTAKQNHRYSN